MQALEIATPRWAADYFEPARYKFAYGGRGSGKSHFFGEYIIEAHAIDQSESTVCVRQVQKSLDQSVKKLLEQKIEKLNAGYYFEVQDAKILSTNGTGIITFQGMQNHTADSVKSLEGYKRAWVEEAQTLSGYSLELLRPTIRIPDSELLFSWNPRYKTDPVDVFFRGKNKPQNAIGRMVNWRDNPWFPDVLRQEMEQDYRTDPDRAAHIWEGAYGSSQGAILARWVGKAERDKRIHNDVVYDPDGMPIEVSADLGFRDTASFWYWQRVPGGVNVLKYDGDNGLDADEWIPRIQDNIRQLGAKQVGKIWLPHDSRAKTFQSRHTTMERFITAFGSSHVGLVPQSKKQDQISAAREVIDRCAFNAELCEAGLDGLRAWEFLYSEDNGVFSREPNHNWASHPSDAFAYGAQVMQDHKPKKEEKMDIFPVKGQNNRIITAPLDTLWAEPSRRNERI
jgi:phage terminase large subunit